MANSKLKKSAPLAGFQMIVSLRTYRKPVATLCSFFFLEGVLAPAMAWAQPDDRAAVQSHEQVREAASTGSVSDADAPPTSDTTPEPQTVASHSPASSGAKTAASVKQTHEGGKKSAAPAAPASIPELDQALALPNGADKSGVTSKAISLPQGSGKIQGMGESFSAQLSTGIATFSVPFSLPHARGAAQPALGLSYSSAGGVGLAGMGWDVGVPFIARQTDRGLPNYVDGAGFDINQDRFVFNGGQELVPICVVTGGACDGKLPDEQMPAWSEGSQYFRPRVEGSFLRFFWSTDHLTWRVQDKSGVTMELGVPLDGSGDTSALEVNPSNSEQIFRWRLVRQYDTQGTANPAFAKAWPAPYNAVVYRYLQDGGMAYLADIYDTTPAASASTNNTSLFAHHTRLKYEPRSDPTSSYRSGWRMDQTLRLARIDVASKTFNGNVNDARHQVRRYRLSYEVGKHISTLASVQVEGRCQANEALAPAEENGPPDPGAPASRTTEQLRDTTNCEALPPMTFGYSHVTTNADLPGYDGFTHDLLTIASSPPHSADEELTDLFDINSDGLPDVLNTAIGTYGYGHGVFFNSAGGTANSFGAAQLMTVQGVLGANADTITFRNLNLSPMDLDGDGSINLLHMPQLKTYSSYSPVFANGAWSWQGRTVDTASGQSPKIDFGKDTLNTKVMDVNGDGLVDLVVSTGTEYQTFLALGRVPQGDGQFGHGSWKDATTGTLSNDPIRTCVPWSSTPVQLSDPEVQVGDMNGDGLPDIVRVRRGDIRYWPGRGDGVWGIGDREACTPGSFSSNAYVAMGGPEYSDIQGTSLRMDDVNGDGLDDLVQVRYDAVDVWLNVDGRGWTDRHIIPNTPKSPSYANRVRLVDVNGSGTRDILWANAKNYQYVDLEGGKKSFLLTHVENGLGKSTDIEYSTSTAEMLAAESLRKCDPTADAALLATSPWSCAWTTRMPTVAHVVKRVTESDNLSVAGSALGKYVTEYQYRDPLFEGRQREFRGFARARSHRIGDANSPGDYTESAFLLGECEDETPSNGVDDCALSERWRDNPREALKGLPTFTEKYDERGVYLSTDSSTYRLRELYVGMDGRKVRHAFERAKATVLYDAAAGPPGNATASQVPSVYLEIGQPTGWDPIQAQRDNAGQPPRAPSTVAAGRSSYIPTRSSVGTAIIRSSADVDFFGNKLVGYDFGCHGGSACPPLDLAYGAVDDETIVHVTVPTQVAGDASGWLWRTRESWVTGSAHQETRSHTSVSYNAFGDPLTTQAELTGVVALDRFNAVPSQGTAGAPGFLSSNGTITVSTNTYDATGLGLLVREEGALSRCREVSYGNDPYYAEFATGETIHTSGGCASTGIAALATGAAYDRGFGAPTSVVDMQLQSTSVAYDSFGRLSTLTRPTPDGVQSTGGLPIIRPSVVVSYSLPSATNPVKYSVIHTRTQDGTSYSDDSYLESYSYVDGLGRTRIGLSEADPSAHDEGAYIVSGVQLFDAKSAVSRKYVEAFTNEAPDHFPLNMVPPSAFGRQRYDAFGRQIQTFDLDGTVTLQSQYHALSSDLYDGADLENGPHQGSYASTRSDGHGRTIATTERAHTSGVIEAHEVRTQYLTTGEPEVITRVRVGKNDPPVVRWMRYDSLGHLVLNADPNTGQNFTSLDRSSAYAPSPTGLKAWRYAFDDAGDLVGTSDARGCGENFTYDNAGRILTEDYSPCGTQGPYSPPDWNVQGWAGPAGFEVIYHYDTAPQLPLGTAYITRPTGYASAAPTDTAGTSPYLRGRLVAVWSLGETKWNSFDARGRVIQTAVIPALPRNIDSRSPDAGILYQSYGHRAYYRDFVFDAADREVSATTGSVASEVPELEGAADSNFPSTIATSAVVTEYSHRGTVKAVRSTYGELVTSITRSADGLVQQIVYGDAAHTTTDSDYDVRRRLRNVQTYRGPPSLWGTPNNYTPLPNPSNTPPTTFQLVLQDEQLTYDVVGNPTEIHDYRSPLDWPAGSKPVTKKIQYDDLYRATRIDYQAAGGADAWTSPFAAELAGVLDSRRAAVPGTHIAFDSRPLYQNFSYDWLGNTQSSDDDAHGFYDRSLGTIVNDIGTATGPGHPYQLKSASNKTGPSTTRNGSVVVRYDAMGNINRINLERNGPCLPAGSPCSVRFSLLYDAVGRLYRIFRTDVPTASLEPIATDMPTADRELFFLYDESDERIVKTYTDETTGNYTTTYYPYESLEIRGTSLDPSFLPLGYNDTALNSQNEVPYLVAHGVRLARVNYEPAAKGEPRLGTTGAARQHVLFELGDQLGSTNIVIDRATSELVEASTYQGYGAKESDYRPERWKGYRDDYGFTGKEEDAEFGLVYFGKRFYSPQLNRWITADPLAVHAPGSADLNLYAWVHGGVFKNVDPVGLEEKSTVSKVLSFVGGWVKESATTGYQIAKTTPGSPAYDPIEHIKALKATVDDIKTTYQVHGGMAVVEKFIPMSGTGAAAEARDRALAHGDYSEAGKQTFKEGSALVRGFATLLVGPETAEAGSESAATTATGDSTGLSTTELQAIADDAHGILEGQASTHRTTTINVHASGNLSATGSVKPNPAQRARLAEHGVTDVPVHGNATRGEGPTGHHGEQRGIQHGKQIGDPVVAQASSSGAAHGGKACESCASAQAENGVTNVTGKQ